MAALMSSCTSLALAREHGLSGVLIVMIFEGVDVAVLGVTAAAADTQDAGGAATRRWPPHVAGLAGDRQKAAVVRAPWRPAAAGVAKPPYCLAPDGGPDEQPLDAGLPPPAQQAPPQQPEGT